MNALVVNCSAGHDLVAHRLATWLTGVASRAERWGCQVSIGGPAEGEMENVDERERDRQMFAMFRELPPDEQREVLAKIRLLTLFPDRAHREEENAVRGVRKWLKSIGRAVADFIDGLCDPKRREADRLFCQLSDDNQQRVLARMRALWKEDFCADDERERLLAWMRILIEEQARESDNED